MATIVFRDVKCEKGINYYASFNDARDVMGELIAGKIIPDQARIVSYLLGYAIQLYKSGPYWGDAILYNARLSRPICHD